MFNESDQFGMHIQILSWFIDGAGFASAELCVNDAHTQYHDKITTSELKYKW